jgi:GAF domain-containing protein/nitrogen-specific signal transduction histidine kinase
MLTLEQAMFFRSAFDLYTQVGAITMTDTLEETGNPTTTKLLEHRVRELNTLHEIARAVTSVLDLESVLNRIVEAAVYLTNAEEGFLFLVDEESGDLTLRAGKGLGEKASRVMSLTVTDSIPAQVVKTGRPVRVGGVRRDEEYKVKTGYFVKSLLNVPIKSAGRIIGVLGVDHSIANMRSFGEHDVALLSSLADYAAIAIQNASLYAEASARADQLAKALEKQTGRTPAAPSPEDDRRALEQFAQGLRTQRDEVLRGIEGARKLAQGLQSHARDAEEVARRLGLWDEEVLGLLPQLEWLAKSGLPRAPQPSAPVGETPTVSDVGVVPSLDISDSHLVQYLAEGALLCDAKGVVHHANQSAAQILGKSVSELINSDLRTIVDDPRWERLVGSLRLALAMGSSEGPVPPAPETTVRINDHVIHAKLIPIYDSRTGAATITATFLRDISAETEGWRARDETLTALSHKMRGPMTAIASYSELLLGERMGVADPMQRRYLERIYQGVERLEAVLNELGDEPATAGRRTTPVPTHPVTAIINQAVDAVQNMLSLDGVSIVRDIGHDLPPVQVDANYVSRILADLMTAAGARTGAGDSVSVSTQVRAEGNRPGLLVILIQGGDADGQAVPRLEEDEGMRAAVSLAEDAGGRIWMERQNDGSNLICFLLPVVEPVARDQSS